MRGEGRGHRRRVRVRARCGTRSTGSRPTRSRRGPRSGPCSVPRPRTAQIDVDCTIRAARVAVARLGAVAAQRRPHRVRNRASGVVAGCPRSRWPASHAPPVADRRRRRRRAAPGRRPHAAASCAGSTASRWSPTARRCWQRAAPTRPRSGCSSPDARPWWSPTAPSPRSLGRRRYRGGRLCRASIGSTLPSPPSAPRPCTQRLSGGSGPRRPPAARYRAAGRVARTCVRGRCRRRGPRTVSHTGIARHARQLVPQRHMVTVPAGGVGSLRGAGLSKARFLTVQEVADLMRVSSMTVYRLIKAGELPAVRVGRSFRVAEPDVDTSISPSVHAGRLEQIPTAGPPAGSVVGWWRRSLRVRLVPLGLRARRRVRRASAMP